MTMEANRFKILETLGEGSFAVVVLAYDNRRMTKVAIKCVKDEFESLEEALMNPEVQIFRCLPKHPNIVNLLEVLYCKKTRKLSLIFEYMDSSLYDFIICHKNHGRLTQRDFKFIFFQIAKGIGHMHGQGLFHRDIKPENILINKETLQVKVADFGCCKGIYDDDDLTEYISTRWYRPPECGILYGLYGKSMDIWAMACVFFEVLTTEPMFPGGDELDQVAVINSVIGSPSNELIDFFSRFDINEGLQFISQRGIGIRRHLKNYYYGRFERFHEELVDLMKIMLAYDPRKRASANAILRHKLFSGFDPEFDYKKFDLKDRQTEAVEIIDKMLNLKQKNLDVMKKIKILEVSLCLSKKEDNNKLSSGMSSFLPSINKSKAFQFEKSVFVGATSLAKSQNNGDPFRNHFFSTNQKIKSLNPNIKNQNDEISEFNDESKFFSPYTMKSNLFVGNFSIDSKKSNKMGFSQFTSAISMKNKANESIFASNLFKTDVRSARKPKIYSNPEDAILQSVCQKKTFNEKLEIKKQIQILGPFLKKLRDLKIDSEYLQKIVQQKKEKFISEMPVRPKTKFTRKKIVSQLKAFGSIKRHPKRKKMNFNGLLSIKSCQRVNQKEIKNKNHQMNSGFKNRSNVKKKKPEISEFNVGSDFSMVQSGVALGDIIENGRNRNQNSNQIFGTLNSVEINSKNEFLKFGDFGTEDRDISPNFSLKNKRNKKTSSKGGFCLKKTMDEKDFSFSDLKDQNMLISKVESKSKDEKYDKENDLQKDFEKKNMNERDPLSQIQIYGNNICKSKNSQNNIIKNKLKISEKEKNRAEKKNKIKKEFDSSGYSQKRKMSSIFMNVIKL